MPIHRKSVAVRGTGSDTSPGPSPTDLSPQSSPPLIAIVGRPNVGKSTLFNRLTGSRRSIVGNEPGITRDRIYGQFDWAGRSFRLVDTGGIIPDDPELIPAEIFRQAKVALDEADGLIFVVDARTELARPDYDLARLLQRGASAKPKKVRLEALPSSRRDLKERGPSNDPCGTRDLRFRRKPVFLAVNKVEDPPMAAAAENFRRLGFSQVFPISSEHGQGIGDLLDAVSEAIPALAEAETLQESESAEEAGVPETSRQPSNVESGIEDAAKSRTHGEFEPHETSIAIIGRPNVGKSTLLNALTGSARAIVSPIPGTTRDAVDEVIAFQGAQFRFVDTAGIRRKGKTHLMAEKLSVVMARRHLESADVALLVLDATQGVTASDATIGGYAHESGRSIVIVVNKWDAVTTSRTDSKPPADRALFERQLRSALKYLSYAPVLFLSAIQAAGPHHKDMARLLRMVQSVARERRKRISTGQMNRFLERIDFQRAPVPVAKRVRIFYMTQAAIAPPTFVLFTDHPVKLHFAFERFLENQIRQAFGFQGAPIWFKVKARNAPRCA